MENIFSKLTGRMRLFPGASEEELKNLSCLLPYPLPDDFLSFLKFSNGAFGMIGKYYLEICKAEDILKINKEYLVQYYIPELIIFGTDGGGEGYGFDYREKKTIVVDVPFIGMEWNLARKKGDSFFDFMQKINNDIL